MSREVMKMALRYVAATQVGYGPAAFALLDALREALAEPDQEYDRGFSNGWDKCAERQATQPVQPVQPEPWTPEDTAHRQGGLAQPELSDYQCCDCKTRLFCGADCHVCGSFSAEDSPQEHPEQMARLGWQYVECPACGSEGARAFPKPEGQAVAWVCYGALYKHDIDFEEDVVNAVPVGSLLYTSPPQRQPLTNEEIAEVAERMEATDAASSFWREFARAIEAAHNIGDKT